MQHWDPSGRTQVALFQASPMNHLNKTTQSIMHMFRPELHSPNLTEPINGASTCPRHHVGLALFYPCRQDLFTPLVIIHQDVNQNQEQIKKSNQHKLVPCIPCQGHGSFQKPPRPRAELMLHHGKAVAAGTHFFSLPGLQWPSRHLHPPQLKTLTGKAANNLYKAKQNKAHEAGIPAGDQPALGNSSMSFSPAAHGAAASSNHVPPSNGRAWSWPAQPIHQDPYCTPKFPIPPCPRSRWSREDAQRRWHARPAGAGPPSCKSCPGPGRFNSCLHFQPRQQIEAKFSLLQIISWTGRGLPLISFPHWHWKKMHHSASDRKTSWFRLRWAASASTSTQEH